MLRTFMDVLASRLLFMDVSTTTFMVVRSYFKIFMDV